MTTQEKLAGKATEKELEVTTINWADYSEPKAGAIEQGKVEATRITTWREVIPADKIGKFKNPDEKILELSIAATDGRKVTERFTMPSGKVITPNTKLAKYKAILGNYPKPGDKVNLKTDAKGYLELIL
jgi:hypothetical protein